MNNPYIEICNSKIHLQTNERLYNRNVPSQMLQPYLDVRPVMTKYAYFPIVEPRKKITVPLQQMPTYNVNTVFNPGNATAPWSGFASNVNKESELRNQIYALQKCSQAAYVPSSTSDLYDYKFQVKQQQSPHELLFKQETFEEFNPNLCSRTQTYNMFMNSTRAQVRDMTKQK